MNLEQRYDSLKHLAITRTGTTSQPAAVYFMMFCSERRTLMNVLRGFGAFSTVIALTLLRSHPVLAIISMPLSVSMVWLGMSQADLMVEIMTRIKTDTDFS